MKSRSVLRRAALLLLLLPQLLVLGLGRGLVVCFEPNGGVTVELAGAACCGEPGAPTTSEAARLTAAPEQGCGSCADVRLTVDRRGPREQELGGESLLARPAGPLGDTCPEPRPALRLDCPRGAPPSPHLAHLRSVVLRC